VCRSRLVVTLTFIAVGAPRRLCCRRGTVVTIAYSVVASRLDLDSNRRMCVRAISRVPPLGQVIAS